MQFNSPYKHTDEFNFVIYMRSEFGLTTVASQNDVIHFECVDLRRT